MIFLTLNHIPTREKHKMEVVKEYLEKRNQELQEFYIKAIGSGLYNTATQIASSITELKRVLTLFEK